MKNHVSRIILAGVACLFLFASGGCKKDPETVTDPFNTGSTTRNLIVVISDIH